MNEPFCPGCAVEYRDHKGLIPLCTENQTLKATLQNIASLIKHPQAGVAVLPAIEMLIAGCLRDPCGLSSKKHTGTSVPKSSGALNSGTDDIAPLCFVCDAYRVIGQVLEHKRGGHLEFAWKVTDLGINAMPWEYWRDNFVFLDGSPVGVRMEEE